MNRTSEVEILASVLEDPARSLLATAIAAHKSGRLSAAAATLSQVVPKRPALAWPALLLALEAAELRLGGSVAIVSPRSRFAASDQFPLFEERWGPFGCTVWPAGHRVMLRLVKDDAVSFELKTAYDAPPDAAEHEFIAIGEAIGVIVRSLEECLGAKIRRVSVPMTEFGLEGPVTGT